LPRWIGLVHQLLTLNMAKRGRKEKQKTGDGEAKDERRTTPLSVKDIHVLILNRFDKRFEYCQQYSFKI